MSGAENTKKEMEYIKTITEFKVELKHVSREIKDLKLYLKEEYSKSLEQRIEKAEGRIRKLEDFKDNANKRIYTGIGIAFGIAFIWGLLKKYIRFGRFP